MASNYAGFNIREGASCALLSIAACQIYKVDKMSDNTSDNNKQAMKAKLEEIKSSMWLKKENVRIITDENRNAEPEQELLFVTTLDEAIELYKKLKQTHYAVQIYYTEQCGNIPAGWNLTTHVSYTPKNSLDEMQRDSLNALIEAGMTEAEAKELTHLD